MKKGSNFQLNLELATVIKGQWDRLLNVVIELKFIIIFRLLQAVLASLESTQGQVN